MANYLPKTKRGEYEKYSQLSQVLRNLRGYRVASGDVDPVQLSHARDLYGEDEGKVFGVLITGRETAVPVSQGSEGQRKRKRKRTRRRRPRNVKETKSLTLSTRPTECPDKTPSSSSLSMLSAYTDSSGGEEEANTGRQSLEVPQVIREMFLGNVSEMNRCPKPLQTTEPEECRSSSDGDQTGFFGSSEFESSPEIKRDTDTGVRHHSPDLTTSDVSRCRWTREGTNHIPSLSTYLCWKCSKVGHLAEDCTVTLSVRTQNGERRSNKVKISAELQTHYARCREIKSRKGSRCAECGIHSNLACCLECGIVLCDGRGHLATHLLEHSSHRTLYSYKLQRMLKCCKATCTTVDISDLIMCSVCLGKAFSQHYSMVSATWSRSGLKAVTNALCCEEHFQWHRMNCPDAAEEPFVSLASLSQQTGCNGLISEFFL